MALVRLLLLAMSALAFALPFGGSVAIASCVQQDLATQIAGAETIAVGTVTETRQSFVAAGGVIKFRPERLLKGGLTKEVQVYLGPTHGGNGVTSVDYTAVVRGERHTLYLRDAGDGSYETNSCSGSHAGVPTAEEEKLLGAGTTIDVPIESSLSPVTIAVIVLVVAIAAAAVIRVFLGRRSV